MLKKKASQESTDPVLTGVRVGGWPLSSLRGALTGLDRVLLIVAGALLVIIVGVVTLQVVMRYVFNAPTSWSEELATLLFVWFVMLGIGPVLKHQEHIKVEVLTEIPSPKLKRALHIFGNACVIVLFAVLGYFALQLIPSADRQLMSGLTRAFGTPIHMSVLYWAVPVGSLFTVIFALEQLFKAPPASLQEADLAAETEEIV